MAKKKNITRRRLGILDRYLLRETTLTWVAVTGVLLLILLANKFARFLGEAASGKLPSDAVFSLLALSTVHYLIILVPVGLFLGIILTLGRLYRDSEMAALMACGAGPRELYRPLFLLASVLALFLAGLSLVAGPWAAQTSFVVRKNAEQDAQLGQFESGRFKGSRNRPGVFYTETVSENGNDLEKVFIQEEGENRLIIVTAKTGRQLIDKDTGRRILMLRDGFRYDGAPGSADFRQVEFSEHGIDIMPDQPVYEFDKREGKPTQDLIASSNPRDTGELQWRISTPLMALILTLIAVPLARSNPREGKYGRVVVALLVYVVYSNFLKVSQVWIEQGKLSSILGMWWVHLAVLAFGLVMLARQYGWFGQHKLAKESA